MREMPLPFVRVRIYDRLWLCGAKTVAATRTLNNCLPQHFLHHQRQSQPAFRCALSTIPAMAAAAIVLGGKGSALSAEAVYSVAHGKSKVQIDLSALQKMSNSAAAKSVYSQSKQNGADGTRFLSQEQSRAALVVLASKLLQSHVRPVIPLVIERALNNDMPLNLPVSNSGAAAAVAEMISSFRDGFQPGALDRVFEADLFVSIEEFNAMLASYCVTVGLAALSVYSSSVLSTVADAVAALSCEAVQVNVKGFDLEASVEGFSNKSEIDVASDLRTLLFGSKLVTLKNQGFEGDSSFFSVAPIHGCLREDLKIGQSKVRIDLNSVPNYKRALQESTQLMSLEKTILSLAMSLKAVGETSLLRADQIAKVFILCGGPSALELFLQKQNSVDSLQSIVQSVISKAVISNGNVDAGCIATEVLDLVQHLSHILSLESVCCLSLIALRERMATERGGQEPSITKENAGNLGKQKGEKKKKGGPEFVLGKGTNTIRQSMLNVFQNVLENHSDSVDFDKCLGASVRKFCSFFEPKNSNLQIMLDDVKKILESNETRRLPKIPKGTRDFKPEQMAIRERAFSIIAGVFKRHGAVALDTPVFELRETLMGKYGEDSKLIFDLADQGGEICSLRYDLTVPFARYLAMHNISSLKRYHIARVYRRDNPSKGRYREFYQCDFDIAGPCATMVYDFEVIKVLTELLDELKIGDYEVKLNHRKLLDGMLELCGVPESKFRSICSAIDKLDKQPWDQVEKEMIDEKGLTPDVAKKIGSIVLKKGSPLGMLSELKGEGSPFSQHSASLSTLEELETLFSFLEASGCLNKIVFDLSLARGLDYYTGVIYEAVFKGTTQVGSIAAGGRYDKLVGMFSGKQVPAVGVSLGIERVFTIMEQIEQENSNVIRATQTQVLLVVLGDDMRIAIRLVSELWSAKLNAEFALTSSRKIGKHIEDALKAGIPYMLLLGENELKKGVVKLKDLREKEETEITRDRIIDYLKSKLDANQVKDFVVVQ